MDISFQWPVKILLVHPQAPFLIRNKIIIAADCAALVSEEVSGQFRGGGPVIIGCPLLEDPHRMMSKIALIVKETAAKDIEVYTMEVPCCHAIHMMVARAIKEAGKEMNSKHYIVRVYSRKIEPYRPGAIDESMIRAEREAHGHH
ncbi:MAG: hypothetical protein N3E47_04950 [Candidatus Bathyarchaeota archaeon]|nr:hypothetical protein [Candidatus Bathyarchaeota archaeon]